MEKQIIFLFFSFLLYTLNTRYIWVGAFFISISVVISVQSIVIDWEITISYKDTDGLPSFEIFKYLEPYKKYYNYSYMNSDIAEFM